MSENPVLEFVKLIIEDCNKVDEDGEKKFKKNYEDLQKATSDRDALMNSIELVSKYTQVREILEKEIKLKEREKERLEVERKEMQEKYAKFQENRRFFMNIVAKRCPHNLVFQYTDQHKGEDIYECSICGKVK